MRSKCFGPAQAGVQLDIERSNKLADPHVTATKNLVYRDVRTVDTGLPAGAVSDEHVLEEGVICS